MWSYYQRWRENGRLRHKAKACETVLLTRNGCGLCEEADELLKRFGFEPKHVDIESDPVLIREFGESIPVVKIDGIIRFRGHVNSTLLLRLLR